MFVCTYHASERAHTAETGVIPDPPGHSRNVHCSGVSSFNGGVTWRECEKGDVRGGDKRRRGEVREGEFLQWGGGGSPGGEVKEVKGRREEVRGGKGG